MTVAPPRERLPVTERALWVGPPGAQLCLRLHLPTSQQVRGIVLLCPPLAREATVTHATFRQLAEEIAMAGMVGARLDYARTGDSSGSQRDPGLVGAWLDSVRTGLREVRGLADVPVFVLGMRMGALLAAQALAGEPDLADLLVLWDPTASGRAWLREQRGLLLIGVGSNGFSAVPTPGDEAELAVAQQGRERFLDIPSFAYVTDEAAAIQKLTIAGITGRLAERVCVFARPDRPLDAATTSRLDLENAEWREALGQQGLLVLAPEYAVVPLTTMREIIATFSDAALAEARPLSLPEPDVMVLEQVDTAGHVRRISENHVRVGPVGLVGVTCRPERPLPGSPLVILLGTSNEPHTGPSRAWVELSRGWAAEGLATLRICLSGLGDSPVRPGQSPQVIYAPYALDDVEDIIAATVDPDGHGGADNVVLVGLCSGGYEAIEGALAAGARGVCVLGVLPGAGMPYAIRSGLPEPIKTGLVGRRQAATPVKGWLRKGAQSQRAWDIAARIPQFVWAICDRLGILPSPGRPLKRLSDAQVDTLFLVGTRDARAYRIFAGGLIRRLQRRGHLHLHYLPALDHGMMRAGPRERALRLIDEHVRLQFIAPHADAEARLGSGI